MSYIGRDPVYGALEYQLFTGNGTTTLFTLNYSAPRAAAVLVTVDGVYKIPSIDYSTNNKTLSFSDAPANQSKICVVFLGKELLVPITPNRDITLDEFIGDNTTSIFTLTNLPLSDNALLVYVDGILKAQTADYTRVSNNVTFTSPPNAGAKIKIYNLGGEKLLDISSVEDNSITIAKINSSWSGTVGAWEIASSNFTAAKNRWYMIDTSGGSITMTLPSFAVLGDTIRFLDVAGSFNTNNLTIARNGNVIMGITQDMTVSSQNAANALVYSNATYGWRLLDL